MRVVYLLVLRYLRSNQEAVLREVNMKIHRETSRMRALPERGDEPENEPGEIPPGIAPGMWLLEYLIPWKRETKRHLKELEEEINHLWRSHLPRPPAATPLETVTRTPPTVTCPI